MSVDGLAFSLEGLFKRNILTLVMCQGEVQPRADSFVEKIVISAEIVLGGPCRPFFDSSG